MSEWWTYTLSDFLLFSPRTYLRLIELWQRDAWPLQPVTLALGLALLVLLWRGFAAGGRIAAACLAVAWLFVGWAFHVERYATINWAATYFGWAFALQAALLGWLGIARDRLAPARSPRPFAACVGGALVVLALAGEPLLQRAIGRAWVEVDVFGITPDATALATLGYVLLGERPAPALVAIPALWCLVSGALLYAMEAPDALLPPLAALVAVVLACWKR